MLKIQNLKKSFKNKVILNNINFELKEGKILGLLGPNGSGKTTLMKILLNLSHKDSGEISIFNEPLSKETNKFISFLPDVNFLNKDLTIKKAIENHMYFYPDFNLEKAHNLLEKLKLDKNSVIKSLSKGMIEKLLLILVLSRETNIYILDEPIAGVDIVTRKQILELIIENINENSSVIITTHLIKDIEQIFDEVCFIKDGEISEIYDVEEVRLNKQISVEDLYLDFFGGDYNA